MPGAIAAFGGLDRLDTVRCVGSTVPLAIAALAMALPSHPAPPTMHIRALIPIGQLSSESVSCLRTPFGRALTPGAVAVVPGEVLLDQSELHEGSIGQIVSRLQRLLRKCAALSPGIRSASRRNSA